MLEVADEVVLDGQIAFVDLDHVRQSVHILDCGPFAGNANLTTLTVGYTLHLRKRFARGDLRTGIVEFA